MKKTLLSSQVRTFLVISTLYFCYCGNIFAQSPTRFQIQGTAIDTSSNPLGSATVMLLQRKDSSLINYMRTNDKGFFAFKNIKKGDYLLKISYVGYIPYQKDVLTENSENIELGSMKLKAITKELFEVVVKTARAPLTIKGDTIEYNAASFKVPPGSTVEDLLRKLPGMQVDADGNIKAQGKTVSKVLVDGKSFFGNDPKQATKNLPAEAINKVQVFNDKSEQAKITGVDDGKKEKAINLELKEEFKKGGFGKVTAGIGNINRAVGKVNYNKFDKTNQFALIGLANNINQSGMGWNDYQDFRGSNAFNFGDDADFGFGNNRNMIMFGGSGEDGGGISIPIGGDDRGFSKNMAAGANYNYDTKKNKLSTSYYYNSTQLNLDAINLQQFFLGNNNSFENKTKSNNITFNGNHRGSLRYEKTIDSLNSLILINNTRFNNGNYTDGSTTELIRANNFKSNESTLNNSTGMTRFDMSNTLIFRHKFKKKGRSFAVSGTYVINNSDGSASQESVNKFFTSNSVDAMIKNLNLLNNTATKRNQIKSSLLYIEPLSKKITSEVFYNFSKRFDNVNRVVTDGLKAERATVDSLSTYYDNQLNYNRLGTNLRYNFNGINVSVGGAWQQIGLKGFFTNSLLSSAKPFDINRNFEIFVPNISANLELKNNQNINFGYSVNVAPPTIRDLQPVINNSNPLFISEGNPNLLPEVSKSLELGYYAFNPGTFVNVFINASYSQNTNQIVQSQTVNPTTLITRYKPVNISGGNSLGSYLSVSFPIVKTKLSVDLSGNLNFSKNLTPINDILNQTDNRSYSFDARIDWTPSDIVTLFVNNDFRITNTKYSITASQNQQFYNNNFSATLNVKMPKEFYFKTSLNYNTYVNDRFGRFNQKIPIWNASINKLLGKTKKTEIKLSAIDILNRNLGVSQYASENMVYQQKVQTLAQYFMLSFSYNMRGIKVSNKRYE